ncbi:hypothetical protein [Bradyrhizobium sp. CCBAU 53380]|uniref:hypothetical protein n=1 Tax=Bradyrhizobium sp. CCBAU 53380 TaxID=1325117 RepID=UPI002303AF70|nr:hypothetical protein [Bradyrhizobium sp. CCBAU 53380]
MKIAFPLGGMPVAGLRRERDRNPLGIEKIAARNLRPWLISNGCESYAANKQGARLQLKAARRNKSGKITHQATWIIRDNGRDVGTGCAADEIGPQKKN